MANVPAAMRAIAQYLTETTARGGCQYGRLDCCTFMADWLIVLGFDDVMADRRGTYHTKAQYRAAIRAEGGILQSCRTRFARIGLQETTEPAEGDVALVLAPYAVRRSGAVVNAPVGALCLDHRLRAVVTPDAGVVGAPLHTLIAWKVCNG